VEETPIYLVANELWVQCNVNQDSCKWSEQMRFGTGCDARSARWLCDRIAH
jgi:hypothetical protein